MGPWEDDFPIQKTAVLSTQRLMDYLFEVQNPGCEGQNPGYEGPMSRSVNIDSRQSHDVIRRTSPACKSSAAAIRSHHICTESANCAKCCDWDPYPNPDI